MKEKMQLKGNEKSSSQYISGSCERLKGGRLSLFFIVSPYLVVFPLPFTSLD